MNETIIGIDIGQVRVGIAKADASIGIAFPFSCLVVRKNQEEQVWNAIRDFAPMKIVIGNPIEMSGKQGQMSIQAYVFADKLQKIIPTEIEVLLWDERLSTVQAENFLRPFCKNRKERHSKKDATAASIILQSYLDSIRT